MDRSCRTENTEKTGVTLKMDYPADASDNRIALMVATGEYRILCLQKGMLRH